MKITRFLALALCVGAFSGCDKEEEDEVASNLHKQWKVYSSKVVKLGGPEACAYQTKPSDMDFTPGENCQYDDVYDFSNTRDLLITNGNNKCDSNEPATVNKSYERKENKLVIAGQEYTIVRLTKDTLILDYCLPLAPITGYTNGKMAMKFIRN